MEYLPAIILAAKHAGVYPALLLAICQTETGLNNIHTPHDNGSASVGICQVKLSTNKFMGKVYGKPDMAKWTHDDLMDPEKNARAAALYLRYQLDRYDHNWCRAVASFNSGSYLPSDVSKGLPKNYQYVKKVKNNLILKDKEALMNCRGK